MRMSLFLSVLLFFSCQDKEETPVIVPLPGEFTQLLPVSGSKDMIVRPYFQWNGSSDAKTYTLVIATNNDLTQIAMTKANLTDTVFALTEDLEEGRMYYWKVIALNEEGEITAVNAGLSFRVKSSAPKPSPGIAKYFISPTGEDNPDRGSNDRPFKTLAYASTRVPANEGDTLFLTAGTFVETDPAIIPLGVSIVGSGESLTTLSSAGVSLAKGINANSSSFKLWYDGALIQLVSAHRTSFRDNKSAAIKPAEGKQVIANLTIDGQNKLLKAGLWVENRDEVTVHHVTFNNLSQRGAVFAPGDKDFYVYPEFYMKGIRVHDCTFINSGKDLSDETLGNLCIAQLDGAEIYNITIQDYQGYGVKFIYDGYFKNCKIHDCTITVSESDKKWGEDISIELWNLGPGNEIFNINCNTWLSVVNHPEMFGNPAGTENLKIHDVKMIDKDGVSSKEAIEVALPGVEISNSYFENKGIGMAIWDMGRQNISIHHNVFYNSVVKTNWASGAAIYIDNSRTWGFKNIVIANNVFDTHQVTVKIKGSSIRDIQIANNAFLNAGAEVEAMGENISLTNNLKYNLAAPGWSLSGISSEAANLTGDPGYSFSGDRWSNYYKPQSSSSRVVNNGINVGFSFLGVAPDIGAYELF